MQVMEWHPVAMEPGNPEHILGGTNFNGIGETHDGGRTWDLVYPLVRSGGEAYCNNAPNVLEFASSDAKTVYLGTAAFTTGGSFNLGLPASGIFKSTDGGSTWGEANDALSGDAVVFDLAVEQENKDGVYAATVNHGMLKTTDGGKNWREINQGLGKSSMMAIAIHPQGVLRDPVQAQTLFGGSIISGMFRSTDGGENWSRVSRGIPPEASITSIVFDPTDAEVMYCADIASGVYRSIDGGESWAQMNQGLSNRSIMRLALSADGQHLYAGSLGAGVFRMDLNGQPPAAGIQPGSEFIQPSVPAATNAATLPVIADSGTAQGAGQEIKLVVVGGLLLLAGVGLIWVVSMVRKR
jgi:photosystem II stability/assembly factor-like uncharacterized protein